MPKQPRSNPLTRAARIVVFLSRNPLAEARAIVAACVAEQLASPQS